MVELVGGYGVDVDDPHSPTQLVRPEGIQLEDISPGHQHIDLIYFARPVARPDSGLPSLIDDMRWVSEADFATIDLTQEVATWARKALRAFRA